MASDLSALLNPDLPGLLSVLPLIQKQIPERIYHYTSRQSGHAILRTGAMWASHIRFLNDSTEYTGGLEIIAEQLRDMQAAETDAYRYDLIGRWGVQWPRIYEHGRLVACFSRSRDLLSQWRAYGNGGYAFGFDSAVLKEIAGPKGYHLATCIYERHEHETVGAALLGDAIGVYSQSIAVGDTHDAAAMNAKILFEIPISTVAPQLKHHAFREEGECRLISLFPLRDDQFAALPRRAGRGFEIPYEPLAFRKDDGSSALREVIIAPGVYYDSAKVEMQALLHELGHREVEITASTIPLRPL